MRCLATLVRFGLLAVAVIVAAETAWAQIPGRLSPNQVIALVRSELSAQGKGFDNATPQDVQAAVYAVTRSAPAQAANVVAALWGAGVLNAAQTQAAAQGAGSAVGDAAGAGEISSGLAASITRSVAAVGAATPAGGGGFSFPSSMPAAQGVPADGSGSGGETPVASGG